MILIAVAVVAALFAGSVYALLKSHEAAKAERAHRQRREFDAAMGLTHDMNKRGPTGFQRRAS